MAMTDGEFDAWFDEQASEQEGDAMWKKIRPYFQRDIRAATRALKTLPDWRTWRPSRADTDRKIYTFDDLILDTLRRAFEGGDGPAACH